VSSPHLPPPRFCHPSKQNKKGGDSAFGLFVFHFQYIQRRTEKQGISRKNARRFATGVTQFLVNSVHADTFAVFAHSFETNLTVDGRKQRIVGTDTHVVTGVDMGAALTHQNVTGQNKLTVGTFHAETFGLGITAVFGGTNALFVSEQLNVNL
jgi:hypothetical protein